MHLHLLAELQNLANIFHFGQQHEFLLGCGIIHLGPSQGQHIRGSAIADLNQIVPCDAIIVERRSVEDYPVVFKS